jgi:hypothetical protein
VHQVLLEGRALSIFPCRSDKRPTSPHGFKDASAEPDEIARLWSLYYGPLIGVPTGAANDIAVIDVDPRHGGDRWFHENHDKLPKTRTHVTQHGGWHLVYRHVPGLRTSAGRIAAGVDVRAGGPHIVWWPAHGGRVLCEGPVAEFPRWVLDGLKPRSGVNGGGPAPQMVGAETKRLPRDLYFQTIRLVPRSASMTLHDRRRVCGILSIVVHAIKGTRNDRLFWAACRFGEFVAEGRLQSKVAAELLLAAASGLVRDDGLQSVIDTIGSGLRTVSASGGAGPPFDEVA